MVFEEQPGYFLRAGAAFYLSGLGLIGFLRSGFSLARLGVKLLLRIQPRRRLG